MTRTTTSRELRERLRAVDDPTLGDDVVSLGLVTELAVDGDEALVSLAFNAPLSPAEWEMCDEIRALCRGMGLTPRLYADADRAGTATGDCLPGVRNVVAIGSSTLGTGAGVVAGTVATELAAIGASVGVFDLRLESETDAWLDEVEPPDVSSEPFDPPTVRSVSVVRLGSLAPDSDAVPPADAVLEFLVPHVLERASWGALDYLLVVLPSGTDALPRVALEDVGLDGTIAVGDVRDGGDFERVRDAVRELSSATSVIGAIGTARGDAPGGQAGLADASNVSLTESASGFVPACAKNPARPCVHRAVDADIDRPYLGTLSLEETTDGSRERANGTSAGGDRAAATGCLTSRSDGDEPGCDPTRAVAIAVTDLIGLVNRRHVARGQTA